MLDKLYCYFFHISFEVFKQVSIIFTYLGEHGITNLLLRSSKNVLWTKKLHLTFHQYMECRL